MSIRRLLTTKEVAEMLGISATTVRDPKFRKRIGLNVVRIGRQVRFSISELDAFIDRNIEHVSPPME